MILRDRLSRIWLVALLLHVIAAAAWIYLMPGGFPWDHPRFMANRIIPLVVIAVGAIGVFAGETGRKAMVDAVFAALGAGWLAAAVTGLILFPMSARRLVPVALLMAFGIALPSLLDSARPHLRSRLTVILSLLGAMIGVVIPWTQRAEPATTFPLNWEASTPPLEPVMTAPSDIALTKELRFAPRDGSLIFATDRRRMTIEPMLTFISRSPDRCWTLFAPPGIRDASARHLISWSQDALEVRTRYADLGDSELRVTPIDEGTVELEAMTRLEGPVYSHLNTFCYLAIEGYEKLALSFSPCAAQRVDVRPMDYPAGRPARFAYLDGAGVFHVVEAASGEKGPFHELASGKLDRGEPLEITLYDGERAIASIVLADWSAQVSTELSPTAGWRVPQNAIEFSRENGDRQAAANIFVSLAATSVGRGFDSVGHAPGIYRNRMKVRLLPP